MTEVVSEVESEADAVLPDLTSTGASGAFCKSHQAMKLLHNHKRKLKPLFNMVNSPDLVETVVRASLTSSSELSLLSSDSAAAGSAAAATTF